MTPKIMIVKHRSADGQVVLLVFALADGMIIGSVQQGVTKFGVDFKNNEERCFLNNDSAEVYIKDKCREYLGRDDVDFLVEEGDPIVQRAQNVPQRRM